MSNWYGYSWELAGASAEFHVDLSFVEEFDALGDFTTLLYVSCYSLREGATAFTPRELRALPSVLDDCVRELGNKAVYVGFIDVQAQRRYYFYTSDARLLVPLMNVCAEQRAFRVTCTKCAEPNRQTYYRLLVPDAAKRQVGDNCAYIDSMRGRGDDLSALRRVNLHMHFPSAQGREQFMTDAKAAGFAIGRDEYVSEHELPYAVALHQISALNLRDVSALTSRAIGVAETFGGKLVRFDSAFVPKRSRL